MAGSNKAMRRAPRTWASRAGMLAIVVIAVQLLWRTVLLARGFFSQDDFLVMSGVHRGGIGEVLSTEYAGGFSPGGAALAWLDLSLAPLSWPLAAGTVLLLQTAATAAMWLILTRILGDRWLRLPLLVMFAFTPLTLWSTQWWVLGLQFWGSTLFLLVGAWAVLVATAEPAEDAAGSTRSRIAQAAAVVAVAGAVLFDERAVIFPIVLLGVALIGQDHATLRNRAVAVAHGTVPVWIGSVAVVAAYLVLRWQVDPITVNIGDELGDVVTGYLRLSTVETLGGPWFGTIPGHAFVVPPSWVVALQGVLLLGLAGFTLQRGGLSARLSWGLLVLVVACSVGLLAVAGRGQVLDSLGLIHRYAAGVAPVAAICFAGALRDIELPVPAALTRQITVPRFEAVIASFVVIALTVSAVISTAFLAPNMYHRDDRRYVEHVRSALRADSQVVLLDSGVPAGVISPWYGARAVVSSVVGYAPENPVFDLPSQKLRTVLPDGTLAPVAVDGAVTAVETDNEACPYPVRSDGTLVPLRSEVPLGRWILQLGYYTGSDGFATVDVAGDTQRFAVAKGLNQVQLVVVGAFDEFRMTLGEQDKTLCLADVAAGVPVPGVQ